MRGIEWGMPMTQRIAETFARGKRDGKPLFVAYLCAGDPDYAASVETARTVLARGVDILELGVPFSDPLADGLTNQLAAQRALDSGMRPCHVFDLAREIRTFSEAPLVLYTYYNLVFSMGEEAYAQAAADAGVDGILVLDLPPEEAGTWVPACEKAGVKTIFILAPTTPQPRIGMIAEQATGFLYYVCRLGVTGVRDSLPEDLADKMALIRAGCGDKPVVIGFGISNREQVMAVGCHADGVVVGSALVNCVARHCNDHPRMLAELGEKTTELTGIVPSGEP